MDSTANESQHSENNSNRSADLQHFPNDQTYSKVTSKDSLFSSERKEDAYTSDDEKRFKKNIRQRMYHQTNLTALNSIKRSSYYKRKLATQEQKCEALNTEKKMSFQDEKNK